jgi:predicted ATPase with chaperone activity
MIQSGEPAEFPTGFKEVGLAAFLATEGGGGPSLLLLGPPGAGTSMLTHRLTSMLPAMPMAEAREHAHPQRRRLHRRPHDPGHQPARFAPPTTRSPMWG